VDSNADLLLNVVMFAKRLAILKINASALLKILKKKDVVKNA